MKIIPTNTCRLISERISEIFRNSQNKKPTIIKNKFGFKLNLGIISFRLCRKEIIVEAQVRHLLSILFYPTFIKSNNVGALTSISASYRYERLSFQ